MKPRINPFPARFPSSIVSAIAVVALAGMSSAQITKTDSKTETKTTGDGTVQTKEVHTTQSIQPRPGFTRVEGTIARYDEPTGKIMVRTKKAEEPIGFVMNTATKLTDLDGKLVAAKLLKRDIPVIVQYAEDGTTLAAADIQVQRYQVPMPDGTITLTTRETLKPGGKVVEETTAVKTTTVTGTLSAFESGSLFLKKDDSSAPVIYLTDSSTVLLNAAGKPLAVRDLAPGASLSIGYVQDGEKLVAREIKVVQAPGEKPIGQ